MEEMENLTMPEEEVVEVFENRVVRYTTKIRRRSTTPASMSSSITY
jgi:hypothetical protein